MSESSPEIEPTQEPFVIRAHHLAPLRSVLNGYDPIQLATDVFTLVSKHRIRDSENDNSYKVDVYGITDLQKNEVINKDAGFYRSVIELENDHPIKISTDLKDAICSACVVGQHCDNDVPYERNRDIQYFDAFVGVAKKLHLDNDIIITSEESTTNTGDIRVIQNVETTAKIVREIIGHRKFSKALKNPDALLGKPTDILYKAYPVKTAAGMVAGLATVSTLFNAGQFIQALEDYELIRSAEVKIAVNNNATENFEDMSKSALVMSGALLTYIVMPRRRKIK